MYVVDIVYCMWVGKSLERETIYPQHITINFHQAQHNTNKHTYRNVTVHLFGFAFVNLYPCTQQSNNVDMAKKIEV